MLTQNRRLSGERSQTVTSGKDNHCHKNHHFNLLHQHENQAVSNCTPLAPASAAVE